MANFTAGTSFTDGVTNDVTAAKLNALVADAVPTSSLALASTTGTISNFTASTANITLGTIPTLTAGTTTSTAANITNGTIQTLTSSTATITGGTFSGSINSTTGTIGNLSTTLAGDFTISQGTGTLGTTGATAATYGTTSDIPRITVDAKGRITAASTVTNPVGFRNRIINGDMRIDQRNAGASVNLSSSGAFPIDRFVVYTTSGTGNTATRSTTAASGFTNSIAITIGTGAAPIAGSFNQIGHIIEGFNVSDLGFGSASAGSVTISFWVRASISGTYCVALLNAGSAGTRRSYIAEYSISATNTWEKKTLTISGDTSGTWATDNGQGIQLWFDFGSGSDYQGTKDNWSNGAKWRTSNQTNLVGTNGATFYITGVQLEAGSTATEFERRPYGTELALCQRYYQKYTNVYQNGAFWTNSELMYGTLLPVQMRSAPTATLSNVTSGTAGSHSVTATHIRYLTINSHTTAGGYTFDYDLAIEL